MGYKWVFESGENPVHVESKSLSHTFAADLGLRVGDATSPVVQHTYHPGFGLQHGKKTNLEKKGHEFWGPALFCVFKTHEALGHQLVPSPSVPRIMRWRPRRTCVPRCLVSKENWDSVKRENIWQVQFPLFAV